MPFPQCSPSIINPPACCLLLKAWCYLSSSCSRPYFICFTRTNCSLLSSPMEKLVISKLIFSWLNYLYAYVPHKSLSSIVMIVLCVQSLGLTHDPVQSRCSNHVCAIDLCARDVELALQHSIFDCDYFSHEKWYAGCIFQNWD